ncbi:putative membrane protein [Kitasatospora sp. MAA4]|uniref:hypothetical protein n=1 Tax=Kitasatospora sp. MAA4 TaxID=3035093 RepID=UPI0024763614|nr:hypothetical protein [Kitasatospora sp. MAA4]MDH6132860.1 putative membrane protein [Kitasatospora sp. MAA4]
MLITFSTSLVFFLITLALIWAKRLGIAAVLVAWLSGFTAAAIPGVAGPVNQLIQSVIHAVGH